MAKGVILLTDDGVHLLGTIQCSNGAWFDASGSFKYCNCEATESMNKHQAFKLKGPGLLTNQFLLLKLNFDFRNCNIFI